MISNDKFSKEDLVALETDKYMIGDLVALETDKYMIKDLVAYQTDESITEDYPDELAKAVLAKINCTDGVSTNKIREYVDPEQISSLILSTPGLDQSKFDISPNEHVVDDFFF